MFGTREELCVQLENMFTFDEPLILLVWTEEGVAAACRESDEFDAPALAGMFWRWQTRFASLKELEWLRLSDEPLYAVMYEIPFIVRETPEPVRQAERWQVPNKLTLQGRQA